VLGVLSVTLGLLSHGPASGQGEAGTRPVVEVGYASGLAARSLSAEDRKRIESLPLHDGLGRLEGRYANMQVEATRREDSHRDDGVAGYWGLDAVRRRQDIGPKPYAGLLKDGCYQTERIIFADLGTGATMMKLTHEPYGSGDELSYFGKAAFSADGSLMVWQRSQKVSLWGPGRQNTTDTHGPVLLDGDGTRPRIAFRDRPSVTIPVCSPSKPELAYAMAGRDLVELNLRTGGVQRTIKSGLPSWWLKLSPDAKYACSMAYGGRSLWVVSLPTGQQWDIPLKGAIHDSYRFVPANTDWVMYWYEGGGLRNEGFHITNFKTGEDRICPLYFDWNHGDVGRFLCFHCTGTVSRWDGQGFPPWQRLFWPDNNFTDSGPYYDQPAGAGGYAQHWPEDELWAHGTRTVERPYLSEVFRCFAKPFPEGGRVNRFRVCYTNLMRKTDRKGAPTVVLDRPNISPDGTKLLFNSNVFAQAEVYLVELRKPRPPVNLKAEWSTSGVKLTWKHPKYHQEIKGYSIYRSSESGKGFELLAGPVAQTTFSDTSATAGRVYWYAVRSVEHSRLESGLCAEVGVASDEKLLADVPLRIFAEAEDAVSADLEAPPPDGLWVNFDGMASNLHYLWQRRKDKPGQVEPEVHVPRRADYYVYARLKGREGARVEIHHQLVEAAGASWQWVRSPGKVSLNEGSQKLLVSSSRYGSALDCFYLSTDGSFEPAGRLRVTPPEALRLSAAPAGEGQVRLSWERSKDRRISHYNLYCSDQPNFAPDRKTLIASPDVSEYLDWQAGSGRWYYRVSQVTLDGLESKPSNEVSGSN